MLPESDPDEELKSIRFTREDRDLILGLQMVDPEIENRFRLALLTGKEVIVPLNAYDLDELLGSIAAVANHEENSRRRKKIDALFGRVCDHLETQFPQQR